MFKYFYLACAFLVACSDMQNQSSDNTTTLINKAVKGDTESQFELGFSSIEDDPGKSAHWFNVITYSNQSNKNHLALAEYNLSLIYEIGNDEIEQNKSKSLELLKRSAFHGSIDAQYRLGILDFSANKKNLSQAVSFLTSSALQGNSDASVLLSVVYDTGRANIPKNKELAFYFAELGSENKNPGALLLLSIMYYNGEFVKQDKTKAIELCQMAVDNDTDGKFNAIKTLNDMKENQLTELSIDLNEGMLL